MLFAIGNALPDGADHITGLADTDTDLALFVANDNDGSEAHLLAAFDRFGDASDLHHTLLPFGVALLVAAITATAATFATPTATLFLLLAFCRSWDVGSTWNVVGLGLRRGISHGSSRDQN